GFRPGRGCHDAIEAVYNAANGKTAKRLWVLDADLKAAFDHIDHDLILGQICRRLDLPGRADQAGDVRATRESAASTLEQPREPDRAINPMSTVDYALPQPDLAH